MIKLVACDLDGTLMGEDLEFSPRVLDVVQRVQARGIKVVVATGRGFVPARHFARKLGTPEPLVCFQGAQVRTQSGEIMHQAMLSHQVLPEVVALCNDQGWELTVYHGDNIYYTSRRQDDEYYQRWFSQPAYQVADLVNDLSSDPIKFIIIAQNKADGDHIQAELAVLAAGRFQVTRSHDYFIEGLALPATKANGVARLAQSWDIAREQVMALGDNGNDLSMVEWAGLGVAIGNAASEIKAVADVVAPTVHEDGAAWAMAHYILGEAA